MHTRFYKHTQFGIEVITLHDVSYRYPEHTHTSSYTVGYLVSGELELRKKGCTEPLSSGSVFIIAPNEPHAIIPGTRYTMTTLSLSTVFIRKTMLEPAFAMLDTLETGIPASPLREAVCRMYAEYRQRETPKDGHVMKMCSYIRHYPEVRLNLDQIAKTVYASKYHLIRRFRRDVGLTPHRYQIQNQIRKAQRLLELDMTIAEVALAVGFYDQSHLNKHFKAAVGMTPSEYKAALCIS